MQQVEAAECQDLCLQYQETIVYAHLRQPPAVTQRMVGRWKDELANRRQYLSYLQSLLEDVSVSMNKVTAQREVFLGSLDELQTLVRRDPPSLLADPRAARALLHYKGSPPHAPRPLLTLTFLD